MPPRRCRELLRHAEAHSTPPEWAAAEPRIAQEARHLDQLLASPRPPAVYGVNTLVGHLDASGLPPHRLDSFQTDLILNHALGSAPYYDEWEARCVGYAKGEALSRGGSAVTPDLYRHVCQAVPDAAFRPEVPRGCSYSCGDVIPGAHWARALAAFLTATAGYTLRRKEGLALINGAFVHVGFALSLVRPLHRTWSAFLLASRLNARLCRAHRSHYTPALADDPADPVRLMSDRIRAAAPEDAETTPQNPVSIRAFPQAAAAAAGALAGYLDALDQALARRSDNPLIVAESPESLSQGSFLAPMLSLATGQVTEALLLLSWMGERRTHYLLSGQVPGVPINAGRFDGDLGLIQVPKLMTAVLEEARLRAGRRAFASGGSTSYGVEDLWSYGVDACETLAAALDRWVTLLALELTTAAHCFGAFAADRSGLEDAVALLPRGGGWPERCDAARRLILHRALPDEDAFPFG